MLLMGIWLNLIRTNFCEKPVCEKFFVVVMALVWSFCFFNLKVSRISSDKSFFFANNIYPLSYVVRGGEESDGVIEMTVYNVYNVHDRQLIGYMKALLYELVPDRNKISKTSPNFDSAVLYEGTIRLFI